MRLNKFWFWFLSMTWGLPMTLIGLITLAFVKVFRKNEIVKNGYTIIVKFGGNWGGISLGAISFCGSYDNAYFDYLKVHEFGHSVQNTKWGILFPLAIGLPSLIRCVFHLYTNYESIWFERNATKIGEKYIC